MLKRVTGLILGVGAIVGIETFLRPDPAWHGSRLALALGAMTPFGLAAAVVGVFAATWWLVLRLEGPVRPAAAGARPGAGRAGREARGTAMDWRLSVGRSLAGWWMVGGAVGVVIMSDTRTGPLAWAAGRMPGGATWWSSFSLGILALAAPLAVLALLPRPARWPVLAGVRDAGRPGRRGRH